MMTKCQCCDAAMTDADVVRQVGRLRLAASRIVGLVLGNRQLEWAKRSMPLCESCVSSKLEGDPGGGTTPRSSER